VTSPLHVPICAPGNSIIPAKRCLIWRPRPARDTRWACPNFSMISSMASATSADRPARDIGGSAASRHVPSGVARRSRWQRLRARSSLRTAGRSAARRAFSRLPRRRSRHFFPQVCWVFAVDGAGVYQHRHSQQRRRGVSSWSPIPRPWPKAAARATSPRRSGGRGGSHDRRRVDLRLAAAKALGHVRREDPAEPPRRCGRAP
jgi:hypothetical protein